MRCLLPLPFAVLLAGCADGVQPANEVDRAHSKPPVYPKQEQHDGVMGMFVGFCNVAPSGASTCHLAWGSNPAFAEAGRAFLAQVRFTAGTGDPHRRMQVRFITPAQRRLAVVSAPDEVVVRGRAGSALETVRYNCLVGLDAFVHDCAAPVTDTPDAIAPARIALAHLPLGPAFDGETAVARRRDITVKIVPPGMDADNPFN